MVIMKHTRWGLVAALLMATACGNPPTVTGGASPSAVPSPSAAASPTATPSSKPQFSCSSSNRCLVLVTLHGSESTVVRDITDIAHPTTISNLGSVAVPQFVSATEVSYPDATGLVKAPLTGSPKTRVVAPGNYPFVWSPDGKALVYAVQNPDNDQVLHLLRGGTDKVLGLIPFGAPGGCENIAGCAIANDLDQRLSFSPDGQYISLVDQTFAGSTFRIWYQDGTLLKSDDTLGPTWSIWSGGALYYRDSKGVEAWRDGTVKLILPGVRWINPTASPAGRYITYTARDADGWGHIYVVDTTTATTRAL